MLQIPVMPNVATPISMDGRESIGKTTEKQAKSRLRQWVTAIG
jgi:hypothetical protein